MPDSGVCAGPLRDLCRYQPVAQERSMEKKKKKKRKKEHRSSQASKSVGKSPGVKPLGRAQRLSSTLAAALPCIRAGSGTCTQAAGPAAAAGEQEALLRAAVPAVPGQDAAAAAAPRADLTPPCQDSSSVPASLPPLLFHTEKCARWCYSNGHNTCPQATPLH